MFTNHHANVLCILLLSKELKTSDNVRVEKDHSSFLCIYV